MQELTTYQLFCKIRGETSIEPVGSTYADEHKIIAQSETHELASYLIEEVANVAQTKGNEYSIEKARNYAIKWLKDIRNYIDEIIEENDTDENSN